MSERLARALHEEGDWSFALRDASLTISPDRHETVYSFDREGRPISWFEDLCVYKRSLASEVHGREQFHGARRRWIVSPAEARERFERMLRRVAMAPAQPADPVLRSWLARIAAWTPEALLAERQRFDAVYEPIGILPPDQYFAVVLQATLGCAWSRCTFCDLYESRRFEARSADAFRAHVQGVKALLGRAENLRRRIFLADGNALGLSNERLEPILEIAREAFPDREVAGFVDVYAGRAKSAAQWGELRERGLRRVHVGVETGHDPLLTWLNKPGSAAAAVETVRALKAAGLAVGVIVMCGVGGVRWAEAHVADTLELLAALPLRGGDILYLSPFVEFPGSAYEERARLDGIRPLEAREREAQLERLREGARAVHRAVRTARYDLAEFLY